MTLLCRVLVILTFAVAISTLGQVGPLAEAQAQSLRATNQQSLEFKPASAETTNPQDLRPIVYGNPQATLPPSTPDTTSNNIFQQMLTTLGMGMLSQYGVTSPYGNNFTTPLYNPYYDTHTEAGFNYNGYCPDGRCYSGPRQSYINPIPLDAIPGAQWPVGALAHSGSDQANTAMQQILEEARKCRDLADFLKSAEQKSQTFNSCAIYGAQNPTRSKGMCASATKAALCKAGICLPAGNAAVQKQYLRLSGLQPVAYSPHTVPGGTVLVCSGGAGHDYGHIELVVLEKSTGRRYFCSDYCSLKPGCSGSQFNSPQAYQFPGA